MRSDTDLLQAATPSLLTASGRRAGATPTGSQSILALRLRRVAMGALTLSTYAALSYSFAQVIGGDGWSAPELAMFVCFLVSSPWIVLGFWNATIGFALLRFAKDPVASVAPCVLTTRADAPVEGRHAIVMCIRHEDSARVVRRLDAIMASLDATPFGDRFDLFVLSDSQKPELIEDEEAAISAWRAGLEDPSRVIYRRRDTNEGFKAGNIREFLDRWADRYEVMITLDADSVMSGATILRLVRIMQANPKLGILQTLVVGLPARTVFGRAFQFGMRASMRSYSMGAAWWSGDCGPYWGHNAAIRAKAFRDHARLPKVPGAAPLGGDVLSHDLYEAVLMRKAGYEVRVLPEESGSWEDNPATLTEFIRRNLRWCQGNMQYLRLIGSPGLPFVGRVNLLIAILMYLGAPAWMGFMIAGAAQAWGAPTLIPVSGGGEFSLTLGTVLLAVMMLVLFAPKIMGYLDVALRPAESRRYGGVPVFLGSVAAEVSFGLLFAPIVSFTVTAFLFRLFVLRRGVGWAAQNRAGDRGGWRESAALLWPATAFGCALALSFALSAPAVLFWAAPVVASFLLAVPFAVLTSRESSRLRIGAIPEEANPPAEVRAVSEGLALARKPPRWAQPLSPFRFDGSEKPGAGYSAAAPAE